MIWNLIKNLFSSKPDNLLIFGRTDTGITRPHNEDSFCILPDHNLMMVADGMGGHNAGEVASRCAIESMVNLLNNGKLKKAGRNRDEVQHIMVHSLCKTNDSIMDMSSKNEKHKGMGCTFVAGYVGQKTLHTCHVGDVRAYIARAGKLKQITTDHTYAAEFDRQVEQEPDLENTIQAPARNIVSRAVGFPFNEGPEYHTLPVISGDRILLCSDGLWSMIDDRVISKIIGESETPEQASDVLIEQANKAGGKDNITAVVAFVQ